MSIGVRRVVLAVVTIVLVLMTAAQAAAAPPPFIKSFKPSTGQAGTRVSLKGSGFTSTTEVSFSGVPADFTVKNDTTLNSTVPLSAQSGAIRVTTPAGQAVSSKSFTIEAPDKPYFRVDGDVLSGGWFNTETDICRPDTPPSGDSGVDPGKLYQAPTFDYGTKEYEPAEDIFKGGILAYTHKNNAGKWVGAGADYGAWAMGLIEGDPARDYGFTSGDEKSFNDLTFANTGTYVAGDNGTVEKIVKPANYWGGLTAGANPQSRCIPDYFHTKQTKAKPWTGDLSKASTGQYIVTNDIGGFTGSVATLNTQPISIQPRRNVTLFVKGDVYIGADVRYASGYSPETMPHFALVALGNIYVGPEVGRIDGLYIAQPDMNSQDTIARTGALWTCHGNSIHPFIASQVFQRCDKTLKIFGAIIAKQVNFLRTGGKIADRKFAEVISYVPEMVIGGPFFNIASSGNELRIESIVSLPPIF